MTLPYSYARGQTIYYQRAIPGDLQARCGAARVKVKLGTLGEDLDIRTAARRITTINREVEAEWARLKATPDAAPRSINAQALELLGQWGLSPGAPAHDDDALSAFHDSLDIKREKFARGDEDVYRDAPGTLYLSPIEVEASQLLAGTVKPRLSAALTKYLEVHPKRDDPKFRVIAERAFNRAVASIGDKPITEVSREDGHALVKRLQRDGLATGSIRRNLKAVHAVMATYLRETESKRGNPFSALAIPNEGEDEEEAVPYTAKEMTQLVDAARAKNDAPRWLVLMVADSGARISEIAGLAFNDIKLDDETPHIVIQPHPWRSLKNGPSKRTVPLVGNALWAAQQVRKNAATGQRFAFPRYTKERKGKIGTSGSSASATINKWIKGRTVQLDHTVHELRHTMADRLRNVRCPADVRLAIGGWARDGEGENYGDGYTLQVKQEWLLKVTTPPKAAQPL